MTKNSDLWLSIERYLDSARNWNLYRRYEASLATRVEGFSECWGDHAAPPTEPVEECWKLEEDSVGNICSTDHPVLPIRIVQYRPAWLEQLALRIAGLPHVVVNSNYAVTESIGPLPLLQDLQANPPAMTGRLNTATKRSSDNAILGYLKVSHDLDLDRSLVPGSEELSQARAYKKLILETLGPCLTILQYQDVAAWDQINRPRCLRAGSRGKSQFLAYMQARSEKMYELSKLSPDYRKMSTEDAMQQVRETYQVFDHLLSRGGVVMGTTTLTLVDVLLWDHLMHALTDIHLVIVLADFPALVTFVQRIWEKYFLTKESSKDWEVWNAHQNEINAFCEVPCLVNDQPKESETPSFQHAIDLMEQLSVRDRNLVESLIVAKEARALQIEPKNKNIRPFRTWHRWRMGGSRTPPKVERPDVAGQQEEKVRREYKINDETWMASVAVGTAACVLLFGMARPQQE
jgi:hypothetical protein